MHAPTESLVEVNFKVPLTKRARPDGECERFTLRGSWLVTLGASGTTKDLRASVGRFGASASQCVNQKRGEFEVAIRAVRYRELFRSEIADTVADPAEVESEVRYLASALGGH